MLSCKKRCRQALQIFAEETKTYFENVLSRRANEERNSATAYGKRPGGNFSFSQGQYVEAIYSYVAVSYRKRLCTCRACDTKFFNFHDPQNSSKKKNSCKKKKFTPYKKSPSVTARGEKIRKVGAK